RRQRRHAGADPDGARPGAGPGGRQQRQPAAVEGAPRGLDQRPAHRRLRRAGGVRVVPPLAAGAGDHRGAGDQLRLRGAGRRARAAGHEARRRGPGGGRRRGGHRGDRRGGLLQFPRPGDGDPAAMSVAGAAARGGASAARVRAGLVHPLALGACVFAACVVGIISRPEHKLATFWPTNALLLGILVRWPHLARQPLAWAAALAGYVGADLAFGAPASSARVLTAANLVSVVAGLRVAGALRIRETAFSHPMGVLKLFLACMSASALAGLAGVVVGRLLFDMAGPDAFGYWMSAELVCYLSLLPAVLLAPVPGALPHAPPGSAAWLAGRRFRAAPLAGLALSVLAATWMGGAGALMLPVPALLWCALAYSLFATALLTLGLSVWTLVAIGYGFMPLRSPLPEMQEIISLRVGVAFLAVAPLTVAVVNAARDRLLRALDHAASHDSLTRVLNRDAFFSRAHALLASLAVDGRPAALLLLDVDHFRRVNDLHGHVAGDRVLETLARRMSGALRP